jgi:AcrR family transcriptional regulator
MGRRPQPERRAALLVACTRHVLAHGLAGLSVASMAKAVGTSPRMLIYHFTTKDQLVTEVLHTTRVAASAPSSTDSSSPAPACDTPS